MILDKSLQPIGCGVPLRRDQVEVVLKLPSGSAIIAKPHMPRAIRFHQTGGPEVLQLNDVPVGEPGPGQARLRHTAIGVNFIDIYQRSGLYPVQLPAVAGNEGAGIVEAVGADVRDVRQGDRVAYTGVAGSYCERRLIAADRLVKLPEGVSDQHAAAMLLKGLTVQFLIFTTHPVQQGESVLWHAAAGGVGLIAVQWLRMLGVTTIGTAGSDAKCALAQAHGAAHMINYSTENFVERVAAITGGKKVPVVYDSVGKSTWEGSLDCLRPRGLMVSFGNASGPVPPVDVRTLSAKGSLYLTRPTLYTHIASRADLVTRATALFDVVRSGKVQIEISHVYPLAQAAQAHRDLESRKTTGSIVLIP
jgi:NADPH:quinone reductase